MNKPETVGLIRFKKRLMSMSTNEETVLTLIRRSTLEACGLDNTSALMSVDMLTEKCAACDRTVRRCVRSLLKKKFIATVQVGRAKRYFNLR